MSEESPNDTDEQDSEEAIDQDLDKNSTPKKRELASSGGHSHE